MNIWLMIYCIPAALDAFPDVYTERGIISHTYFKNCDFDVDGSPTIHTLISPRKF